MESNRITEGVIVRETGALLPEEPMLLGHATLVFLAQSPAELQMVITMTTPCGHQSDAATWLIARDTLLDVFELGVGGICGQGDVIAQLPNPIALTLFLRDVYGVTHPLRLFAPAVREILEASLLMVPREAEGSAMAADVDRALEQILGAGA